MGAGAIAAIVGILVSAFGTVSSTTAAGAAGQAQGNLLTTQSINTLATASLNAAQVDRNARLAREQAEVRATTSERNAEEAERTAQYNAAFYERNAAFAEAAAEYNAVTAENQITLVKNAATLEAAQKRQEAEATGVLAAFDIGKQRVAAGVARDIGAIESTDIRKKEERNRASFRARSGASGVLVEDGSSIDVLADLLQQSELTALRAQWQREVEAVGHETDIARIRYAADMSGRALLSEADNISYSASVEEANLLAEARMVRFLGGQEAYKNRQARDAEIYVGAREAQIHRSDAERQRYIGSLEALGYSTEATRLQLQGQATAANELGQAAMVRTQAKASMGAGYFAAGGTLLTGLGQIGLKYSTTRVAPKPETKPSPVPEGYNPYA